jgi:hypothetical protein
LVLVRRVLLADWWRYFCRLSFLHAVALVILGTILAGFYYVYSILEPFIGN